MDQEMYGSIMLYTSNAIYAALNKASGSPRRRLLSIARGGGRDAAVCLLLARGGLCGLCA
jgi:hypothetical protein